MKTITLLFIALLSALSGFAQDIIIKKNGEELETKIQELTPETIKYKRSDNPDGPLYTINKREVFMIKYQNGTKDIISVVTPQPASTNAPQPAYQPAPLKATTNQEQIPTHLKLGGPRLGLTVIGPGEMAEKLRDRFDASPVISQFGWQFETRIFSSDGGVTGLIEFVPLIGGLEQSLFLPSATALMGLRSRTGFEFGVGPNLSLAGAGLAFAAGTTITSGSMNFPINFAVVPSKEGARYSLLFGFNYRKY